MAPYLDESRIDSEEAIAALDCRQTLRVWPRPAPRCARRSTCPPMARDRAGGRRRAAPVGARGLPRRLGRRVRRPGAARRARLAGAGQRAPQRAAARLGRSARPGHRGLAVGSCRRARWPLAAEAARRGASLLTVGAADSPLADVAAQARGVHIDIGRGRTTVAHRAVVAARSGAARGRRAGSASTCGRAGAARHGRPARRGRRGLPALVGVLRQPGQGPRHRPWPRSSRRAGGRPAQRRRRRPGRVDAGPHRPDACDVRRAPRRRRTDRGVLRRARSPRHTWPRGRASAGSARRHLRRPLSSTARPCRAWGCSCCATRATATR